MDEKRHIIEIEADDRDEAERIYDFLEHSISVIGGGAALSLRTITNSQILEHGHIDDLKKLLHEQIVEIAKLRNILTAYDDYAKFAEILSKAIGVFGSQEDAEKWLGQPAVGLDQRRPIDLLVTPAGVALVEEFLDRLEYGVYT